LTLHRFAPPLRVVHAAPFAGADEERAVLLANLADVLGSHFMVLPPEARLEILSPPLPPRTFRARSSLGSGIQKGST
jgi:hypothetical protein